MRFSNFRQYDKRNFFSYFDVTRYGLFIERLYMKNSFVFSFLPFSIFFLVNFSFYKFYMYQKRSFFLFPMIRIHRIKVKGNILCIFFEGWIRDLKHLEDNNACHFDAIIWIKLSIINTFHHCYEKYDHNFIYLKMRIFNRIVINIWSYIRIIINCYTYINLTCFEEKHELPTCRWTSKYFARITKPFTTQNFAIFRILLSIQWRFSF